MKIIFLLAKTWGNMKAKNKHYAGKVWVVFWSISTFMRGGSLTKISSFDFYYPVLLAKISSIITKKSFFFI